MSSAVDPGRWEEMEDEDRVKSLLSLRQGESARLLVKVAMGQSRFENTESWSRVVASLVGREILPQDQVNEAEELTREMDEKVKSFRRKESESSGLEASSGDVGAKESFRHFALRRQVAVEKKRTSQVEEAAPLAFAKPVRPVPNLEKSTELMKKHQLSRRKIVRLEEQDDQQPKKKKLSLEEVFGEKLNLVDDEKREILQAFLEKRPKPTAADCDMVRIKIHEETTTEDSSQQGAGAKKTKVTLYAVLDWEKYSYQKTRKRKTTTSSS